MAQIRTFNVMVEGLAAFKHTIPIINGGTTHLPGFEYTNEHDCPVLLYGQINRDVEEFLGPTIMFVCRNYIVQPHETTMIRLELFRGYSPYNVVMSKTGFQVEMVEICLDNEPVLSEETDKEAMDILDEKEDTTEKLKEETDKEEDTSTVKEKEDTDKITINTIEDTSSIPQSPTIQVKKHRGRPKQN